MSEPGRPPRVPPGERTAPRPPGSGSRPFFTAALRGGADGPERARALGARARAASARCRFAVLRLLGRAPGLRRLVGAPATPAAEPRTLEDRERELAALRRAPLLRAAKAIAAPRRRPRCRGAARAHRRRDRRRRRRPTVGPLIDAADRRRDRRAAERPVRGGPAPRLALPAQPLLLAAERRRRSSRRTASSGTTAGSRAASTGTSTPSWSASRRSTATAPSWPTFRASRAPGTSSSSGRTTPSAARTPSSTTGSARRCSRAASSRSARGGRACCSRARWRATRRPATVTLVEPSPTSELLRRAPGRLGGARALVQHTDLAVFERLRRRRHPAVRRLALRAHGQRRQLVLLRGPAAPRPRRLVHVHDILFPEDYHDRWILDEGLSWNEQYLRPGVPDAQRRLRRARRQPHAVDRAPRRDRRRCTAATGAASWLEKLAEAER